MAMMKALDVAPLGLTDAEVEVQFEKLQAKLIPLWQSISGLSLIHISEPTRPKR